MVKQGPEPVTGSGLAGRGEEYSAPAPHAVAGSVIKAAAVAVEWNRDRLAIKVQHSPSLKKPIKQQDSKCIISSALILF
jgi:hypothetical protein